MESEHSKNPTTLILQYNPTHELSHKLFGFINHLIGMFMLGE